MIDFLTNIATPPPWPVCLFCRKTLYLLNLTCLLSSQWVSLKITTVGLITRIYTSFYFKKTFVSMLLLFKENLPTCLVYIFVHSQHEVAVPVSPLPYCNRCVHSKFELKRYLNRYRFNNRTNKNFWILNFVYSWCFILDCQQKTNFQM